jgi:hypothetical protein
MPRALVVDEMNLGKGVTSVAAAMICKLLTEKVVMRLLLSTLGGNTNAEWASMGQKNFPRMIGDWQKWYLSWRHNSVPRYFITILNTQLPGYHALTFALEPILVVTMPGVVETFTRVSDEMTYRTKFKLID